MGGGYGGGLNIEDMRGLCGGLWGTPIWPWVNTNGIPFWGRCTTHFRTYFSGGWDVHRGITGLLTTAIWVKSQTRRHPGPRPCVVNVKEHVAGSESRTLPLPLLCRSQFLDFNFVVEIKVFSTKPPKSYSLFAGGPCSNQDPAPERCLMFLLLFFVLLFFSFFLSFSFFRWFRGLGRLLEPS